MSLLFYSHTRCLDHSTRFPTAAVGTAPAVKRTVAVVAAEVSACADITLNSWALCNGEAARIGIFDMEYLMMVISRIGKN